MRARAVKSASGSTKVFFAGLIGNTLIAITKFIASVITGSSAMLSVAIHSLVDTSIKDYCFTASNVRTGRQTVTTRLATVKKSISGVLLLLFRFLP
ncbi:cation transporter [Nitrosomonas aestuarii]|uniref:cation transporter n=1 Tax=Nitrosomonas aestuarii TaxID=52441 RepID=UPI0034E0A21C